jgi:hypothetical protein
MQQISGAYYNRTPLKGSVLRQTRERLVCSCRRNTRRARLYTADDGMGEEKTAEEYKRNYEGNKEWRMILL